MVEHVKEMRKELDEELEELAQMEYKHWNKLVGMTGQCFMSYEFLSSFWHSMPQ